MKILNTIFPERSNSTWNGKYSYTYSAGENGIDLEDAIKNYLEHLHNSCAPNTLYCYSRDLNFLLKHIGNIKLDSLSEDVLNDFITQLCCSGKKCSKRSGTTLNRIKSVYRSFLNFCFKKNILQ